ncbi:MAG TPA: glycosyltransferase [Steroidobacter sp.]|jgi:glycosyltransferase involved in cell wall biosynthesis|nr:glycosyltransferase [Steroidobacter sp.]
MPMTIVSVAYPLAPVRPDAVGGAEHVLLQLDRALVRAGHRSVVVACTGSRVAGKLAAFDIPRSYEADVLPTAEKRVRKIVANLVRDAAVDLVHIHALDFSAVSPSEATPTLVTLHLPRSYYAETDLRRPPPNLWLNCVSRAQSTSFADVKNIVATIENGVRIVRRGPAPAHARSFAVWFGRICPEKAPHLAIEAAMKANAPLVLAGRAFPYPTHLGYFESHIAAHLGPRCRFVGPVGGACKRTLLRHARCLIVSSQAPETSSLAAREALASGTPVVAFRTPALEQLIEHGVTGFLVGDNREMAAAIRSVSILDPRACIRAAKLRCNESDMTSGYLQLYETLRSRVREPARALA